MREFDQLRAYSPPLVLVPGVPTVDGSQVIGNLVDTNANYTYEVEQDGWHGYVETFAKPGTPSGGAADWKIAPYVWIYGYRQNKIEWSPYARMEIAAVPVSHDVADGTLPQAFYGPSAEVTINNDLYPSFNGAFTKIVDIWCSEKLPEAQQHNLVWNGIFPATEPGWIDPALTPTAVSSHILRPQASPADSIRLDQVISARYRTFGVPVGATDSHNVGGGYQPLIHEAQIGGNATISDNIYHYRAFFCFQSTTMPTDNWSSRPSGATGFWKYNYLKSGLQIPASIDTLTISLDKVESDAEWATLAARGMKRNDV